MTSLSSSAEPPEPAEPSSTPTDVVHVGLGSIGQQVVSSLQGRSRYRSAGAVDIDPELVGRTLKDIIGPDVAAGHLRVVDAVSDVPPVAPGAIAVHCAGSSLETAAASLTSLLESGFHVVSTCEELSYPWVRQAEIAARLDRVAQVNGVALLGTGVNPGYAMDYLPVVLAATQRSVRSVLVHRVQDAGQRRPALQRKVGAGLTGQEFAERVQQGSIRHVGLPESALIIDRALDLGCTDLRETIDPVVADVAVPLGAGTIEPGRVLGIDQRVHGKRAGTTVLQLHLQLAVGLDDPRDIVRIDGEPGLETVSRGLHGDRAAAAVVVNSLGRVQQAQPGLRAVDELPASPLNLAGP